MREKNGPAVVFASDSGDVAYWRLQREVKPENAMSMNDEPTLSDLLGREGLIREVGDTVATCRPPHVFGVHGDWGLGKTSFLHQVQYYLTGDCPQQPAADMEEAKDKLPKGEHQHVAVVWFEAWRYQYEDVPVVALLHEIRAQLDWQWKLGQATKKATEVTIRGALMSLEDLTKKIGFQASKIQAAGERWERDHLAAALPSHTIREQLQQAIRHLLPSKKGIKGSSSRVVVLIDDLDRCEPSAAYRLLEGLKIYLTIPNCVFVLGMNQSVIEEAIAGQLPVYEILAQPTRSSVTPEAEDKTAGTAAGEVQRQPGEKRLLRAGAYMEKLCQNVWRLPLVRKPEKFLYETMDATKPVRAWVNNAIKSVDQAPFPCLPRNPRRLKALASLIDRLAARLPEKDETPEPSDLEMRDEAALLLVVAYIYQFHPELYHRWENNLDLFRKLADWAGGAEKELPVRVQPDKPLHIAEPASPESEDELTGAPPDIEALHRDPSDPNVFWIQSLVYKLRDADPQWFARYILGPDHV